MSGGCCCTKKPLNPTKRKGRIACTEGCRHRFLPGGEKDFAAIGRNWEEEKRRSHVLHGERGTLTARWRFDRGGGGFCRREGNSKRKPCGLCQILRQKGERLPPSRGRRKGSLTLVGGHPAKSCGNN